MVEFPFESVRTKVEAERGHCFSEARVRTRLNRCPSFRFEKLGDLKLCGFQTLNIYSKFGALKFGVNTISILKTHKAHKGVGGINPQT